MQKGPQKRTSRLFPHGGQNLIQKIAIFAIFEIFCFAASANFKIEKSRSREGAKSAVQGIP